jgi:hypothetical protein
VLRGEPAIGDPAVQSPHEGERTLRLVAVLGGVIGQEEPDIAGGLSQAQG